MPLLVRGVSTQVEERYLGVYTDVNMIYLYVTFLNEKPKLLELKESLSHFQSNSISLLIGKETLEMFPDISII